MAPFGKITPLVRLRSTVFSLHVLRTATQMYVLGGGIFFFCYKFNNHFVAFRCIMPLYVGSSGSRQITVFGWWFFKFINAESSLSHVLSSRIVRQTWYHTINFRKLLIS